MLYSTTLSQVLLSFRLAAGRFFVRFCLAYNKDCFHNFCLNNIPVAQLQIASLVEELLSLSDGFVTFDCGYFFFSKK